MGWSYSQNTRKQRGVHSHTFEIKGVNLGTSETMTLIILRASGEEKN